jgi:hypothetical protein
MPDQVGLRVGMRIGDRVTHAGLRTKMDDAVEPQSRDRRLQRGHVGKIDAVEIEAAALLGRDRGKPILLERDRTMVVQIVDSDHRLAARDQAARHVTADEPGDAGHEDRHGAVQPALRRASWRSHTSACPTIVSRSS